MGWLTDCPTWMPSGSSSSPAASSMKPSMWVASGVRGGGTYLRVTGGAPNLTGVGGWGRCVGYASGGWGVDCFAGSMFIINIILASYFGFTGYINFNRLNQDKRSSGWWDQRRLGQ